MHKGKISFVLVWKPLSEISWPLSKWIIKVRIFWEGHKNMTKSPNFFLKISSYFSGLLRMYELYLVVQLKKTKNVQRKYCFLRLYSICCANQNSKAWLATYFELPHPQLRTPKSLCTRTRVQLAFLIVATRKCKRNFIKF